MSTQEIIVAVIVLLCIVWAGIRTSRYFKHIKNNDGTCGCGCADCAKNARQNQRKSICQEKDEKILKKASE